MTIVNIKTRCRACKNKSANNKYGKFFFHLKSSESVHTVVFGINLIDFLEYSPIVFNFLISLFVTS